MILLIFHNSKHVFQKLFNCFFLDEYNFYWRLIFIFRNSFYVRNRYYWCWCLKLLFPTLSIGYLMSQSTNQHQIVSNPASPITAHPPNNGNAVKHQDYLHTKALESGKIPASTPSKLSKQKGPKPHCVVAINKSRQLVRRSRR